MAAIEKRIGKNGRSTYRARVRLKGFPDQSATFEKLTDAKRWVQQTESAMREGRHFKTSEAKRRTMNEAIDKYIKDVMPLKPRQSKNTLAQLAWWKSEIGVLSLANITPHLIAEKRDKLASSISKRNTRYSPSTVVRYLAALSHVLTIATNEWAWIEDSPMRRVTKPKEPRGRVRFLSDDERRDLLEACKQSTNELLYPAVVVALSTGARKMEVMNLRWADIDFNRQAIMLHDTKNNERRSLPLKGHALELIEQLSKVRKLNCDLLFSGRFKNQPVDLRTPFNNALKKAGIKDFKWHDLRHSCASYLAMNGASLAEIAEILGHKSFQMVKRYAHLSDIHTSKVVEKMNDMIFG